MLILASLLFYLAVGLVFWAVAYVMGSLPDRLLLGRPDSIALTVLLWPVWWALVLRATWERPRRRRS